MSIERGCVSVEATVWCANMLVFPPLWPRDEQDNWQDCWQHHQQSGPPTQAIQTCRAEGWKLTRKYGWLCPRCVKRVM